MASSAFIVSPLSPKSIPKSSLSLLYLNKTRPIISFTKPFISNVHNVKFSRTDTMITTKDDNTLSINNPTAKIDQLKIAIIGFGNFGQFIAKGLRRRGHEVLATSRSDYSDYCKSNGIHFFRNMEEMCEEKPDIVLICCSILSTETMVRAIPIHKLKPDTIFVDVLSVKQFPRNIFLEVLPPEFGIVCTHPMFGPESGKNGWNGLPFVYEAVRINEGDQVQKCAQFLSIFQNEGCRMVEMSCEEHDRHAAVSQFITHTIGRILSHLNLECTPINTKGYETLLQLTENTVSDSFDLYYGLFMYNVNATEQVKRIFLKITKLYDLRASIDNLDRAFETVKQKLFGRLHDLLRKQIVERVPMQGTPTRKINVEKSTTYNFLQKSEEMKEYSSFVIPPSPPPPPPPTKQARRVHKARPPRA